MAVMFTHVHTHTRTLGITIITEGERLIIGQRCVWIMKPELTPAKRRGFLLTGHLKLPPSAGLEGRRGSRELMGKKWELLGGSLSAPAQRGGRPSAGGAPTSPAFAVNPLLSRISHGNGGEMLHQLFCSELSKTLASPGLSLVTASRAGEVYCASF